MARSKLVLYQYDTDCRLVATEREPEVGYKYTYPRTLAIRALQTYRRTE